MANVLHAADFASRSLRLDTLVRLRWLAVGGQAVAVFVVAVGLGFDLPVGLCFALIGLSAVLNLVLRLRYPATLRLADRPAAVLLAYDVLQLAGLLYSHRRPRKPFAILILVPVIVSATTLAPRATILLGGVVVVAVSVLAVRPLAAALVRRGRNCRCRSSMSPASGWRWSRPASSPASMPSASPRRRGSWPRRLTPPRWCSPASSISPRSTVLPPPRPMSSARRSPPLPWSPRSWSASCRRAARTAEDVALLSSQSQRCRDILAKRLTSLSSQADQHLSRQPLSHPVDEVVEPYRSFPTPSTSRSSKGEGRRAGRPAQSGDRPGARQPRRERRRFRPRESRGDRDWDSDEVSRRHHGRRRRASPPASSSASASPISRRGRPANSSTPRPAASVSAFSSPRHCSSAAAPACPSPTAERRQAAPSSEVELGRAPAAMGPRGRGRFDDALTAAGDRRAWRPAGEIPIYHMTDPDIWSAADDRRRRHAMPRSNLRRGHHVAADRRRRQAVPAAPGPRDGEARLPVDTADTVAEASARRGGAAGLRRGRHAPRGRQRPRCRRTRSASAGRIAHGRPDRLRQHRHRGDRGEARRGRLSRQAGRRRRSASSRADPRTGDKAPPPENPMSADRVRWEHIQRVYELCDRNVSETARRLNMHRRTLQRILAKRAPR